MLPSEGWKGNALTSVIAPDTAVMERARSTVSSRPHWLRPGTRNTGGCRGPQPSYVPELDGLRGLAVAGVFAYHMCPRLRGTWMYYPASAGWSGVNLFFVLSGFLITSILLRTKETPHHYFRSFYARRVLRIWPVYFLLLAVCYLGPNWLLGTTLLGTSKWHALPALVLFVQNLFPVKLQGALEPTWSLAIEEQYYLLWAPVVRFVRRPAHLAGGLAALLALSPLLRLKCGPALNPAHTLLHLDCITFGSLLGLGIASASFARHTWLRIGFASTVAGFGSLATLADGTVFADSALGLGFAGIVLMAVAGTGASNPIAWLLRRGPLPFYGQISYGLYLVQMPLIISLGALVLLIDHSRIGGNWEANLAIVAIEFLACTAVALLLWHGLESRILRLKRHLA